MILCLLGSINEIVTIALVIPDAADVYNSDVREYNLVDCEVRDQQFWRSHAQVPEK